MNSNTAIKRTLSLKCGTAIKLLSIIALVFTVLSHISYFFYYSSKKINGEWVYELTFRFPHFTSLISLLVSIAPFVLFVIYVFRFHNELKATVLIPIILGLFPLEILISFLFGGVSYGIWLIIDLLIFGACVLAVISALKGFNKKLFVIIPMSLCLLCNVLSIISVFSRMYYYMEYIDYMEYMEYSMYFYVFTHSISIIGSTLLYVSLLLFGVKNKIPSIIALSSERERARTEKMNPEQALKLLKDKLDLGMITEEEYQAQRAEIISKL